MRKDPEKYSCLIFGNLPSTTYYSNHQFPPYGYGFYTYKQEQHQSREDYVVMVVEEADKLYSKLLKDLVDQSIDDYSTPSRTSLPSLPPPDEG
jgi:hypothetical protein